MTGVRSSKNTLSPRSAHTLSPSTNSSARPNA
jgi:hypothetical protein